MQNKKIVIVGAGPAGLMAAIRASQLSEQVTLIEKNPYPGRKLLLSGKGRCNLTNNCDLDSFIKRFSGNNGLFLRDAFKKFFNSDLIEFFEKRGLKLKTERQLRVFPVTDRSDSIVGVLYRELQKNKVRFNSESVVKDVLIKDNAIKGLLLSNGKLISAEAAILATGGLSYSFTGSTGDGINIARKLGHRVISPRAGLVPLEAKQNYAKFLEGITLKNIRLIFSDSKKELISPIGELLFTRFGISGPLVLSLSGKIIDWMEEGKKIYAEIDLKPALSREQLDSRLLREFKAEPKKNIKNTLSRLLPKRMISLFLEQAAVTPEKKVSQVTQAERQKLVLLMKGFRLDITKPRSIEEAMVTRGGVSLKDINPRTMESRIIKGLYFAGEMIDVDADTGGFNLQAAFSTGYLAGEAAALS